MEIISNANLSEYFLALGQDLDIMDPKTPEDIYKSSLNETRGLTANVDSARQNLASTFVNAFVNVGFGQDKLVLTEEGISFYIHFLFFPSPSSSISIETDKKETNGCIKTKNTE